MQKLSNLRATLGQLATHRAKRCVSIYSPLEMAGGDVQKNPIELKNLLKKAREFLPKEQAEALARRLEPVQSNEAAKRSRSPGLAIFHSPAWSETFELPLPVQPLVVVEDRFHLKPLLALLAQPSRFYVLALSQKAVRLLEGDPWEVRRVDTNGQLPTSIAAYTATDGVEKALQVHSGKGGTALHHGQGLGEYRHHEDTKRYLTAIDAGMRTLLTPNDAPLVLAGVGELTSAFRASSKHANICEGEISGNVDAQSDNELHQRALPLAEASLLAEQESVRRRARELAHTQHATTNLNEAALAARDGRIDTLFVENGVCLWGRVDDRTRSISRQKRQTRDNEDLLDMIAVQTFDKGGDVFVVDAEQMPTEGCELFAVLRY